MLYELPTKLKIERIKAGQSQAAVAEAIGVNKATISQYETGATTPPPLTLAKLALHYNVTADYLLGIDNRRPVLFEGLSEEQIRMLQTIADEFRRLSPP